MTEIENKMLQWQVTLWILTKGRTSNSGASQSLYKAQRLELNKTNKNKYFPFKDMDGCDTVEATQRPILSSHSLRLV